VRPTVPWLLGALGATPIDTGVMEMYD